MNRLLSLLMAVLLLGGVWYESSYRVVPVTDDAGVGRFVYASVSQPKGTGSEIKRGTIRHKVADDGVLAQKASGGVSGHQETKSKIQRGREKVPRINSRSITSRFDSPADFKFEVTAYTHTRRPTASGAWPKVGCVAVDPKVIPLGTELWIEGYGYAIALDTGADIKGNRLDVFFDTKKEADNWGRKFSVKVWIIHD